MNGDDLVTLSRSDLRGLISAADGFLAMQRGMRRMGLSLILAEAGMAPDEDRRLLEELAAAITRGRRLLEAEA